MANTKSAMNGLDFKIVDAKKWDSLPEPTPAIKVDKYIKILDALEAGEIIKLATKDNNDLKGKRIALGRKSRSRGFVVDFRVENDALYVRKSDRPVPPSQPKKKKEKVVEEA